MQKLSREEKQASGGKIGATKFFSITTGILSSLSALNFIFDLVGRYLGKSEALSAGTTYDSYSRSYEESIDNLFVKSQFHNLKDVEQNRITIFPLNSKNATE